MRKWQKNEKIAPLQRLFSSNMPLLWYCYDIVACSTKSGACGGKHTTGSWSGRGPVTGLGDCFVYKQPRSLVLAGMPLLLGLNKHLN